VTTLPAPPSSVPELVRRAAAERPDGTALVDGPLRWSWAELEAAMNAMAASLGSAGLQPADRIALQAVSSADFVAVYLGAAQAGLVVVPVNPAYTGPELSHILADAGCRLLVTSSVTAVAAAAQLMSDHPDLDQIVVAARSGADGLPTVSELLRAGAELPPLRRDCTGEDLAVLLYTSGTSGQPKGAMLSVGALLANLAQFAALQPHPVSAADVLFLPLPLFHVFGLNAGLGMGLYFGATVVLEQRFDAEASLRLLREERVSIVVGAPVEFTVWAALPDFAAAFAGVRFGLSGSAPLQPDLVGSFGSVGTALFEGYGLTEAAPVVTLNLVPSDRPEGWLEPKPGSIGRPLPGVEVRLLDSDGEAVEPGDLGTLEVRGDNLFSGYWPDGAGGPDADGWFATGDLAVADDDGDYYLVGRRSDLILVNGFNVYPAEVERVLTRIDGIREVAVLGRAESETGEAVVAYVVVEPDVILDPDAVLAQAARSLARFKLPKRIIEVDTLPHTATGKVMKWRLGPVPARD